MVGQHHDYHDIVDMNWSKQGDDEGQVTLACCSPWGHKESDVTEQLNKNNKSDNSEC